MDRPSTRLVVGLLTGLTFAGAVQAERDPHRAEIRGLFVRLTEQSVGERGYFGVVIKPLESDDHVTLLLPRRSEELAWRARNLREGQRVEIVYGTEGGQKWVTRLDAERLQAVAEIEDQEQLVKVVNLSDSRPTILAAIKKISSQTILNDIAQKHGDSWVREIAVNSMTDQDNLYLDSGHR